MSARMNRRTILAGAAAVAVATPAPALALPDPIYAAIAARKATVAALEAFPERGPEDTPALYALDDADGEAIRTMLKTPPTTLRGMRALLQYVIECEEGGDEILMTFMFDDYDPKVPDFERAMGGEVFHKTLLAALDRLV